MKSLLRGAVGGCMLAAAVPCPLAHAQTPEGLRQRAPASTGTTEIAPNKFEAPPDPEPETKDAAEAAVSAGGLLTAGNTRAVATTAGARTRFRRSDDQLSVAAAVNYARSAPSADEPMDTTVENYQGRARYDRFLGSGVAAFLGSTARRDRFQGLDLRFNAGPGLAYYFIDRSRHQLWTELGYDLQYDIRRDETLVEARAADDSIELQKTETRHNVRLFTGYINKLNDYVTFDTGVEYLQSVLSTENWRLNWDFGLTSAIADRFSVATTVSIKYDNNPLPGIRRTDAQTSFNLVYNLL